MRGYHGSASLFKEFDKKSIGRNFRESENSGFFFISGKMKAEGMAEVIANASGVDSKFVYEVDLDFNDPITDKVDSEFISPCDKFDMNPDNYTRDAFIEGKDAIYIQGTFNDDLFVVFEPEQISINRIFENGIEIYNKAHPELTKYPEIMGPDAESNVNQNISRFHDSEIPENLSYYFGDLLDSSATDSLKETGSYSYGDGRHFVLGDKLKDVALNLFCGKTSDEINTSHRENCLIAHDFESGVTMVHDLTGSDDKLGQLFMRPLVHGTGLMMRNKSDEIKSPGGSGRELLMAVGPVGEIEKIKTTIPEYELDFVVFEQRDHPTIADTDPKFKGEVSVDVKHTLQITGNFKQRGV